VFLWDVIAGREASKIDPAAHGGVVQDLDWNYDGSLCATACRDRNLRILDPRNGKVANVSSTECLAGLHGGPIRSFA
jgi:coronin-1B/1C/6